MPDSSLLIAAQATRARDGTPYRVEVGISGAASEATLAHVLMMPATGLPLAVAAAVSGGLVLVHRALQPVERIARKAEVITRHNLSDRLPAVTSGDEIERLRFPSIA